MQETSHVVCVQEIQQWTWHDLNKASAPSAAL